MAGKETWPITHSLLQLPLSSLAQARHAVPPSRGQESIAWQVPRGGETKTSAQGHGDHGQASSRKGCHSLREDANRKRRGRSGGEERLSWVDSLGASYHPTLATGTQLSLIKRSECLMANNQLVLLASLNSKQSSRLVLIASESAWAAINKSHHRPVA